MPWYHSGKCSHFWPMPGIPRLGETWALGSCLSGWSGTPDRNCFPASLQRWIFKVPTLQVGMIRWMILLGVGVSAGRGVHSEEGYAYDSCFKLQRSLVSTGYFSSPWSTEPSGVRIQTSWAPWMWVISLLGRVWDPKEEWSRALLFKFLEAQKTFPPVLCGLVRRMLRPSPGGSISITDKSCRRRRQKRRPGDGGTPQQALLDSKRRRSLDVNPVWMWYVSF